MADGRVKLTKRVVDAAQRPASGEVRLWDADLAGFCLRVYPTGRRVYSLKFRVGTRQRWMTIGEHGKPWAGGQALTPDEARREAQKVIGQARAGEDATQTKRDRRTALTVAELIDRYLDEGPATRPAKRESSWKADRGNLIHHARPQLGDRLVTELTRSDVARMIKAVSDGDTAQATTKTKARGRATIRGGPGIASRVLASFRAMLSWGVEHGVGEANPATGVKLAKRATCERFLSREEALIALAKLDELEATSDVTKTLGAIIRLLLLTGARKTEIAGLRWSEVDFARKRLVLPPERTKAGSKTGERRISLSAAAVELLQEQPGRESWVFPSIRGDGHVTGVQKAWERVRKAAHLPDVRLHDLRHSFASFAIADGASLYLVSKALGHADTRTTERYAHLTDDPLQAVAEATSRALGATTKLNRSS